MRGFIPLSYNSCTLNQKRYTNVHKIYIMKTKIKTYLSAKRLLATLGLAMLIMLSLAHPMHAQTVTQGYASDESIERGMLVSLKEGDATKVELADAANSKRLHGIVVNPNDAPVTLSSETQKIFVATVGRYDVLVSDENGTIKQGDYIGISSIKGVGTKADGKSSNVIGKAVADFDGKSNILGTSDLKNNGGATTKINIARISVDIGIGANPLAKSEDVNLPGFLKNATEAIANKKVSVVRVYMSLAILLASVAIAGSMLYAGVRSSMISIGRNPLSKQSITKSLTQVIITSFIVFIIGIFGVYLLLKL